MANGDVHKLGTLYIQDVKMLRPTKPWYSITGDDNIPTGGNIADYQNINKKKTKK